MNPLFHRLYYISKYYLDHVMALILNQLKHPFKLYLDMAFYS